jgi:hypothetical protein
MNPCVHNLVRAAATGFRYRFLGRMSCCILFSYCDTRSGSENALAAEDGLGPGATRGTQNSRALAQAGL